MGSGGRPGGRAAGRLLPEHGRRPEREARCGRRPGTRPDPWPDPCGRGGRPSRCRQRGRRGARRELPRRDLRPQRPHLGRRSGQGRKRSARVRLPRRPAGASGRHPERRRPAHRGGGSRSASRRAPPWPSAPTRSPRCGSTVPTSSSRWQGPADWSSGSGRAIRSARPEGPATGAYPGVVKTHRPTSPWVFAIRELGRRPGAMRSYTRTIPAPADPARLGLETIAVARARPIELDLPAGVGHRGRLRLRHGARPAGRGVRALPRRARPTRSTSSSASCSPTRTASPTRPPTPTSCRGWSTSRSTWSRPCATRWCSPCRWPRCAGPDCPGLCPDCGEKWADLAPDHGHETLDPRWAALRERSRHGRHDRRPTAPELLGDLPWLFPSAGCRGRTRARVGRSGRPLLPRSSPARTAPAAPPSPRTSPARPAAPTTAARSSARPDRGRPLMAERAGRGRGARGRPRSRCSRRSASRSTTSCSRSR